MVPETVIPLEGEVMLQVGGVLSGAEFCTLTVTDVEVLKLPAAS